MRLLLLRHAKSDRSDPEAEDHDRPLSARGRTAAGVMGAHMREAGYLPALVLCSTAKRTRETIKRVVPAFPKQPEIRYSRKLYLAEWPTLLAAVQDVTGHASPLLLVGHNPGLEQLALALALQPASAAERVRAEALAEKFPTAALAVLDFDIANWRAAKPGLGRLADYVRPKDLQPAE